MGMLWFAQTTEAQTADAPADTTPAVPQSVRLGPPPKRGAAPTRKADERDPTANAGKVTWAPRNIEFGTIQKGKPQARTMTVTNISDEYLVIKQVKTSCHCTSAEFSDAPIAPGKTGTIVIKHNAEDLGEFLRIVSIMTNFDPDNFVMVSVSGEVKE
jgi:hypothetical protein